MPKDFYELEFDEYLLLRKGYYDRIKVESILLRHQTALIVEGLVGKGNGVKYVLGAWKLDGEEDTEITPEQLKALLKHKKEQDALRKLKKNSG